MPSMLFFRGRRRSGRAGFTLIELLTVIGIIAVLIALSASAVIRYIGVQEKSNTQTALNNLGPLLKAQWDRVYEQAYYKDPRSAVFQTNATVTLLGGGDRERQRVIWTYLRLQQAFPMSLNEIFSPLPGALPPDTDYVTKLASLGINSGNWTTYQTALYQNRIPYWWIMNSALLLMALQRGESGGGVTGDILGSSSVQFFSLGNGNNISALVDAWGMPLYFVRWPTGYQGLNPGGAPVGKLNDPLDPQGYLTAQSWVSSSAYNKFQGLFHPLAGTTNSYKLIPLIVSAGLDQQLGIDLNYGTPMTGQASDNLYSYQP
jgi:prepilin-type N-terminal cleavage/methylation domain-containing protein